MKVALINPPRSPYNAILTHAAPEAKQYIHKKLIGPPLGLLTLAAALSDHQVTLLEMKGEYDLVPDSPEPAEMVRNYLQKTDPDIVGVSFIASEFPYGMEILRVVKEYNPNIITVAGGLHATLCPDHFLDPCIDIVCPGPGAYAFKEIVRSVEQNSSFDHIGGIILNRGNKQVSTRVVAPHLEPAGKDFFMPDRSLLKRWISTYVVGRAPGPSTYVFTSLGCPYKCSFCSIWPQFGGHYLQRDVESVIEELKSLDDYDVVRFSDANTLVNLDFAHKLFDRIKEEGIKKTYIMDIRVDTAANHPELIEKLAEGGLKVVITGFESMRQEELSNYNKQLNADLIDRAIDVFHANDILMRGNYIVPPSYAEEDFDYLAEYAGSHRVAFAGYTILTPFPGTSFYQEAQKEIVDFDLAKYNMFNAVMKTRLPVEEFYRKVSSLWLLRRGEEII